MKNKTRRPPLIIHPAPKQSQQGHLETKLEAHSPSTASQHPTSGHLLALADLGPNTCKCDSRVLTAYNVKCRMGFWMPNRSIVTDVRWDCTVSLLRFTFIT